VNQQFFRTYPMPHPSAASFGFVTLPVLLRGKPRKGGVDVDMASTVSHFARTIDKLCSVYVCKYD
jgi:hypothetical protein